MKAGPTFKGLVASGKEGAEDHFKKLELAQMWEWYCGSAALSSRMLVESIKHLPPPGLSLWVEPLTARAPNPGAQRSFDSRSGNFVLFAQLCTVG